MRALHGPRTNASSERGAALVMTLLVLVILTAFGLTLVALGTSEVAMSSNWRDYSKDFYAAEAALESGVVGLRNLLPATPTPTQAQLNTIATPPPAGAQQAISVASTTSITFWADTLNASTTLAAAVTAPAVSVPVVDASGITVTDRIYVNNGSTWESTVVTGKAGNTLSVAALNNSFSE